MHAALLAPFLSCQRPAGTWPGCMAVPRSCGSTRKALPASSQAPNPHPQERTRAASARAAGDGSGSSGGGAWEEMVYSWCCLYDYLKSVAEEADAHALSQQAAMAVTAGGPGAGAAAPDLAPAGPLASSGAGSGPGGAGALSAVSAGAGAAAGAGVAAAAGAATGPAVAALPSLEAFLLTLYEHESK